MTRTEIKKARAEWRRWAEIARTRFGFSGAAFCAVCCELAEYFIVSGIPVPMSWRDAAASVVGEWVRVANEGTDADLARLVARDRARAGVAQTEI